MDQEKIGYIDNVWAAWALTDRPWEDMKRSTAHYEPCLITYAGMWPAGNWPEAGELGRFLSDLLTHILAGCDGKCYVCSHWAKAEGERIVPWPPTRFSESAPSFDSLVGIRLVERVAWEVSIESDPGGYKVDPPNLPFDRTFPRLQVYGRYGVERVMTEEELDA